MRPPLLHLPRQRLMQLAPKRRMRSLRKNLPQSLRWHRWRQLLLLRAHPQDPRTTEWLPPFPLPLTKNYSLHLYNLRQKDFCLLQTEPPQRLQNPNHLRLQWRKLLDRLKKPLLRPWRNSIHKPRLRKPNQYRQPRRSMPFRRESAHYRLRPFPMVPNAGLEEGRTAQGEVALTLVGPGLRRRWKSQNRISTLNLPMPNSTRRI